MKKREVEINIRKVITSSHTHPALAQIFDHNLHWTERFFWFVSFTGSIVLAVILLAPLYERLLNSASVVSVEKDYFNWNVSYPSITLCPDNKIDVRALHILSTQISDNTGTNATAHLELIANINMDSIDKLDFKNVQSLKEINPRFYAQIAASLFPAFDPTSLSTTTDRSLSISPVMTELGMCHAINSNVAIYDDPGKWRDSGASVKYGKRNVKLSVYEADFFAQIINFDSKFKIFFHHPDEAIHSGMRPVNNKLEGYFTFGLQIHSTKTSDNLREYSVPMRKCRFTNEPISKRYPVYSYNHCIIECRVKTIIDLCGCLPHFYRPLGTERVCSIPELVCLSQYIKTLKLTRKAENCGCLSDCEHATYWADEQFVPRLSNTIRVGLSAFPKVRYVRNVIFGPADIFLRAGGVINLCVGTSIISLMELFLILLKCLTLITYKLIKQEL